MLKKGLLRSGRRDHRYGKEDDYRNNFLNYFSRTRRPTMSVPKAVRIAR